MARRIGEDLETSYACELGDLDGDGDLDLVVGNDHAPTMVWLGDGVGNFSKHATLGENTSVRGVTLADGNGDGALDVIVICRGRSNRLHINDGKATFGEFLRRLRCRGGQLRWTQSNLRQPIAFQVTKMRSQTFGFLTCLVLLAGSGFAAASDWAGFRGPGGKGVVDSEKAPVHWDATADNDPAIKWRTSVPGLGHGSPVVFGSKIFLTTAISADGESSLQLGRGGNIKAAEGDGKQTWAVLCYEKASGELLWQKDVKSSTPLATRHTKATHANTSVAVDKPFTWCDNIGSGHPDPDIAFAEGQFYLATQQKTDFVGPGPWVETVEARVGVDTNNDASIDLKADSLGDCPSWTSIVIGLEIGFEDRIETEYVSAD